MHAAPLIVALATTLAGPPADADPRAPDSQPALAAAEEPEPDASATQDTTVEVDKEVVVDKKKAEKKKKKQKVKVTARVMAGWEHETKRESEDQGGNEDTDQSFFLRQARVRVDAKINDRLRAVVSGDLSDAVDMTGKYVAYRFIRTVYVNFRAHDAFQVRAGFFKRPISRLELRGSEKLPFRDKGLANKAILEQLQWGDRAVGLMLWGKLRHPRVRWSAAVMSPDTVAADTSGQALDRRKGVDALGRVAWEPWGWLSVGINGGYKLTEHEDDSKAPVGALGGDVRVRAKGLYMSAEAIAAQNYKLYYEQGGPRYYVDPFAVGVLGYASYDVDLPKKFVLQPVVFGEWVDVDTRYNQSEAVRVVAGLNLLWSKYLRILPQVELIRPVSPGGAGTPWVESETYYIMLSVHMR